MIFYNFLPVKMGGGLQNAFSLLQSISDMNGVLVVGPVLADAKFDARFAEVLSARPGHFGRLLAEAKIVFRAKASDRCFTLFGPPPLMGSGKALNITGCAYSNLLYPEIDFWSGHHGVGRLKKKFIDWLRRFCLSRADYWIFETDILARRAIELFSFPKERVFVVHMAPSRLVTHPDGTGCEFSWIRNEKLFQLLFLAGAHPNKRLDSLLGVAEKLKLIGDVRTRFVLTFDLVNDHARYLAEEIIRRGLDRYFINVGMVRPDQVAALISNCDAMCNFARLESFSNNFVEAWSTRTPLIVTDADWSRGSCRDGAIYVDPESSESVVSAICSLRDSRAAREDLLARGAEVLSGYPSTEGKSSAYMEIVKLANLSRYRGSWIWKRRGG